MKMKKNNLVIMMATALAVCACNDISVDDTLTGSVGGKKISISGAISDDLDTKAPNSDNMTVRTLTDGDLVLKVYEYEEAIDNLSTKVVANQIGTSSLGSFNIYGFLDEEIRDKSHASQADKDNLNFISNASTVKSGSVWNFASGTYNWRYGIHHHFWAYYPSNLGLVVDNSKVNKASFSNYTNDGVQDVLVSYENRYFGNPEEDDETRDATLSLQFHHALAQFCYKTSTGSGGLVGGDGDEDEGSTDRVKINNVKIRNIYTKGDCSVDGSTFTWSNRSEQSEFGKGEKNSATGAYRPWFVIPQERSNTLVYLEATDTKRELTIPFVFEGDKAFGTGEWEAGHRYNYHFEYTFNVPDVPDGTTGIDADFNGKGFDCVEVVSNLPGKYIAQIKLTWTGVAKANPGNGTYFMITVEPDGTEPSSTANYLNYTYQQFKDAGVGFAVNHKSQTLITDPSTSSVGSYDANSTQSVLNTIPCSCIVDIPANMTKFDIYAAFCGGQNGEAKWHMSNMKVEVTKWR